MIMKQTNEELLLQDLCARLPYGVKLWHESYVDLITLHSIDATQFAVEISIDNSNSNTAFWNSIEQVKPYLFPLSSMTEEQLNDFYATIRPVIEEALDAWKIDKTEYEGERPITLKDIKADIVAVNWMLKNHFDMNGLIPMGLAIDATGLNVY